MSKKILSIDWDYFIDADDKVRAWNFNDGINILHPNIQNIIWGGKYNGELEKISILKKDLVIVTNSIFKALSKTKGKIPVSANTEHCGIVEFIETKFPDDKLDIYNIDFHHDAFALTSSLCDLHKYHCGNWLSYLKNKKRLDKVFWIRHEEHHTQKKKIKSWMSVGEINDIKSVNFDGVFICHSPAWSPPHLDKYFIWNFNLFFNEKNFEKAFPDRWKEVKARADEIKTAYKEMIKNDKKTNESTL